MAEFTQRGQSRHDDTAKLPGYLAEMELSLSSTQVAAIDQLGYNRDWVRLGALTHTLANAQLIAFHQSDADKSTEHYRNGALRHFIDARDVLNEVEFGSLMKIAASELTKGLHEHVYHVLCGFRGLSDGQFEQVANAHSSKSFDKLKLRRKLQRKISSCWNSSDVEEAIASGDTQLQAWLVHNGFLNQQQAKTLLENGGSRAVRNLAKVFLRQ